MPTKTEIEIFQIANTQVDRNEVRRWMDHIGAAGFEIPDDGAISNPALLIALAAKNCYRSFEVGLNPNVTRIRQDYAEYLDNILASGHGSVLEHSVFTFAIEGLTRVMTSELNRHRAGWAISECSLRFVRFGENIPYWEPTSIRGKDVEFDGRHIKSLLSFIRSAAIDSTGTPNEILTAAMESHQLERRWETHKVELKKQLTRELFKAVFTAQETFYKTLEVIWADELAPKSKFKEKKQITSMMRRIVGMGVSTGGVWSGNVRALRHVLTMRCSPAAEEEILYVFSRIANMMREQEPLLFGDFYQDDEGYWRPRFVKV